MSKDGIEIVKKILGFVGGILFFASFIPWILVGIAALMGVTEGIFGSETVYGFAALRTLITLFSVIPVFPVCLIIEILYAIFYVRKAEKKFKVISIICASVAILALLIPCCFWVIKDQICLKEYEPDIREYLKVNYGETMSKEAKIRLKYYDTPTFTVSTPVLSKGNTFEISYKEYSDDYMEFFTTSFYCEVKDYSEEFDNYLDNELGLPENYHMDARVLTIDFEDYHYGDDYTELFPRSNYIVAKIYVDVEDVYYEDLLNIPKTVYEEYVPLFEDKIDSSIIVNVTHKGLDVCSIQIDLPSQYNHNRAIAVFHFSNDFKQYQSMDGYVFIDEIGKDVIHME